MKTGSDRLSEFYRERVSEAIEKEFASKGLRHFANWRIGDVGCGFGYWLRHFSERSGSEAEVFGVDLDGFRVKTAKEMASQAHIVEADARKLPWADASFDLVTQFTVFTSVRRRTARAEIAREMRRVLKPGGWIVWYDFFAPNWKNRKTRAIGKREIFELFPDCDVKLQRVTLAPPLARISMRVSERWTRALEAIPFLRSHYLGFIRSAKGNPE